MNYDKLFRQAKKTPIKTGAVWVRVSQATHNELKALCKNQGCTMQSFLASLIEDIIAEYRDSGD